MKASEASDIALSKALQKVYQTINQAAERGLFAAYISNIECKNALLQDGFLLQPYDGGFIVRWDPDSIRKSKFDILWFVAGLLLLFLFLSSGVASM